MRLSDIYSVSPLSAAPSPILGWIYPAIIVFAVFLIVAALALILRNYNLRKHAKIVGAIGLAAVVAVASVAVVLYSEPTINYWVMSPYTTAGKDNMLTMVCENKGLLQGTFDLELSLVNAHFSLKTSPPYQKLDDQTVRFTFTLQPGEQQNRTAWFIINDNVTDFYIYLSLQQNNGNWFVKSTPGGVDRAGYQKDSQDMNFTMHTFAPPP